MTRDLFSGASPLATAFAATPSPKPGPRVLIIDGVSHYPDAEGWYHVDIKRGEKFEVHGGVRVEQYRSIASTQKLRLAFPTPNVLVPIGPSDEDRP